MICKPVGIVPEISFIGTSLKALQSFEFIFIINISTQNHINAHKRQKLIDTDSICMRYMRLMYYPYRYIDCVYVMATCRKNVYAEYDSLY